METVYKKVIAVSTLGIIVFSITFIIGKVGTYDLWIGGAIFLGIMLSYSLGLLHKNRLERKKILGDKVHQAPPLGRTANQLPIKNLFELIAEPAYKNVIIASTLGIVVFIFTFIIGKVGTYDLRIGGVIFLGSMLSYSLGSIYKYNMDRKEKL